MGYAKAWGFDAMCMTNIFAFRATDPKDMKQAEDPIGLGNNSWLQEIANGAELRIAAWGAHGSYRKRDAEVLRLLNQPLHCLGITKAGQPKHPLYLAGNLQPFPFHGVDHAPEQLSCR